MGQILGLGVTHYPGLTAQGNLCRRINICLNDPALSEESVVRSKERRGTIYYSLLTSY
jgi:hypothetical protein